MARLARWCFRHRVIVVVAWLALLVAVIGIQSVAGSAFSNSVSLTGTESTKALDLISAWMPQQAGDSATVVWRTPTGSVTDAAVKTRMQAALEQIAAVPSVVSVTSPYDANGAAQISEDGTTAYADVMFSGRGSELSKADVVRVIDLARDASTGGLQVDVGGDAAQSASHVSLSSSAGIGLAAAAVIILLAFGSLFGMLLPLVTAGIALGVTTFAIDLLSHAASINSVAPTMAMVVGLGVGVDYALFVVTRYRQGLKAGDSNEEAAVRALNTAGPGGALRRRDRLRRPARPAHRAAQPAERPGLRLGPGRGAHHGVVGHPVAGTSRLHGHARAQPPRAPRPRRGWAATRATPTASGCAWAATSHAIRASSRSVRCSSWCCSPCRS